MASRRITARRSLGSALAWLVVGIALGSLTTLAAETGEKGSILEDPAIREVLAMVEAGVADAVILARVEQLEEVPTLSGQQIAELRQAGVSDPVLHELVRRGGEGNRKTLPPPLPEPAAAGRSPAAGSLAEAGIRVLLESSFPVTYFEVLLDGEPVATRGKLLQGESDPGAILKRPSLIRFRKPVVGYEASLVPGEYRVGVGFAVTRVEGDEGDEWSEYGGERYVTTGVRAAGSEPTGKGWEADPGIVCRVAEGEVCVITAHLQKNPPTRFGGLSIYSLSYESELVPLP